jgi:hypothetical protein
MLITSFTMTCEMCPTQYEFKTECNREGYIRYRWGVIRIYLSEENKNIDFEEDQLILWAKLGDNLHGILEEEIILNILKAIGFKFKEQVRNEVY